MTQVTVAHRGVREKTGLVERLLSSYVLRKTSSPDSTSGTRQVTTFWPLKRYPYVVLYLEGDAHIDVWRVLHGHRDIPASMQDPGPG